MFKKWSKLKFNKNLDFLPWGLYVDWNLDNWLVFANSRYESRFWILVPPVDLFFVLFLAKFPEN